MCAATVFNGEEQHLDVPLETPPEAAAPVETALGFSGLSEGWDIVESSSLEHGPAQLAAEKMTCQMTIPIHRPIRVQAVLIQTTKSWAHFGISRCQQPLVWKTGRSIFQHKRTKTLHLLPMGSGNSFFVWP